MRQLEAGAHEPRRATLDVTSRRATLDVVIKRALKSAGVEVIDENGGGPGVRLRKRIRKKLGKYLRAGYPSDNRVLRPAVRKGPTFSP